GQSNKLQVDTCEFLTFGTARPLFITVRLVIEQGLNRFKNQMFLLSAFEACQVNLYSRCAATAWCLAISDCRSEVLTCGAATELRIFNSVCRKIFRGLAEDPSILSSKRRAAVAPN